MNKILSIILFVVIILSGGYAYSGAITDSEFSSATLASLNDITALSKGSVPVGTVIVWPVANDPEDMTNSDGTKNWLECDGQAFNTTTYSSLASIVGTKTPNYQGMFLRGNGSQAYAQNNGSIVGVTSTTYSSGTLGQVQGDATRTITGVVQSRVESGYEISGVFLAGSGAWGLQGPGLNSGSTYFNTSRVTPTAPENRPVNMAVRYLIRALP